MTFLSKILASTLPFFSDCVSWPPEYLEALKRIRDKGDDIDRAVFLAHVNWTLNKAPHDFIPEDDWHIHYKRYEKIYFFIHSGIEFVFATEPQIKAIQDLIDREDLDPESDDFTYDFLVKSEKSSGERRYVLQRRDLIKGTDSRPLLLKTVKEDSDPECVRIAKKRLEEK